MQPKLSKIIHRNETRIRVDFPYNAEMVSKLRQITDARWSKTLGAWHVPYTSEAFDKLKSLFPEVSPLNPSPTSSTLRAPSPKETEMRDSEKTPLLIKKTKQLQGKEPMELSLQKILCKQSGKAERQSEAIKSTNLKTAISVSIYPKIIEIKMPKDEADIQFIRSFKYAKWNSNMYCWTVPNYGRNGDILKSYFIKKDAEITEHNAQLPTTESQEAKQPAFTKTDFLVINTSNRTLRLYFVYNVEISKLLKKIPMCVWNSDRRCWEMPYSEKYLNKLNKLQHSLY